MKKTAILQTKYDWNSTPDGRRTLEQSSTSTGRKASSSYEGGPDFGLGDGPGRWSGMHALPRPVQRYKLPHPEGSPGQHPPVSTRSRQAGARRRRQRRCVHILQTDNSTTKSRNLVKKTMPLACHHLCKSIQYNNRQNPNTKATSNTKTHYKPTIVLEIPFCVEKRNIKKTAILQTKYDWNSTPDGRRTLEQSSTSTGRKLSLIHI